MRHDPSDIYAGDPIQYMNRRRESGKGHSVRKDRLRSKSSDREHIAGLDVWEFAMCELARIEADFFAFLRDSRNSDSVRILDTDSDGRVPF